LELHPYPRFKPLQIAYLDYTISNQASITSRKSRFIHVQKVLKRGIMCAEADHAWFVESAADDTSLIEHLAERRCASK
jgi:hypothetical protein